MGEKDSGSVVVPPADADEDSPTTAGTAGDEQQITAVIDQVAALRSEIDRLIGLVNSASKKIAN